MSDSTDSKQRKKKASRACIHCQKAHLTCDDSRPCQRCVKRNLANSCTDGARKKAKYLQDGDDANSIDSTFSSPSANTINNFVRETSSFQPMSFVNRASSQLINNTNPNFINSNSNTPVTDNSTKDVFQHESQNTQKPRNMQDRVASISASTIGNAQPSVSGTSTMSAYGDGAIVAKIVSPVTPSAGPTVKRRNQIITPEMAYASATKPFSYADGYHYLINYVKTRMSKEDLMRISRSLALFRPSVLASMMNLTEDDLIFTEKCLQRTLLEYEKLISYSGTPTLICRRHGEIVLVGKEFSLLTQWSREALLGKKTYIYELMSNPSAVEYWEKYALHAFDNTDSAVHSTCILMSPTKRAIPCTFCFTIKRDIFDLPSVIIGNFLPILS
ncbi:hypothetical protein K501DRAFT_294165 [Backusella circina FSU 941]|nr:hypothetical protein K501DRAFT_294165 [Backusella circina FSU 941]